MLGAQPCWRDVDTVVSSSGAGRPAITPVRPRLSVAQLLAAKKARPAARLARIAVLPGDEAVAATWGIRSAAAARRGRPRPVNDMWVASCCLTHDVPLATLNVKDY